MNKFPVNNVQRGPEEIPEETVQAHPQILRDISLPPIT